MKLIIALALCVGAVFAAPQFEDPNHFAQHSQSVEAAREGASARLENFGSDRQAVVVPNEEICGLCESGGHGTSDISNSNGVGFVVPVTGGGESSSSASEFSSSSNDASIPVVIGGGSSGSSASEFSSSSQTENVATAPVVIPISGGGSESFSQHSESSSSHSNPVIHQVTYPVGGESYSSHSEKVVSSGSASPIAPIVYPSLAGSERYSQSSFSESSGGVPLAPIASYPSGNAFSSHHSERIHQAVPVTVPIYPTGGASSRYSSSQYNQVSQANPTVIVPIAGGGQSIRSESRFAEIKSTPSTSYVIAPVSSGGSSHKSSSYRESHTSHAAPQYVLPVQSPQSSFSERFSASSSLAAQPSILPVFPTAGSSRYSQSESFSNQGSAGLVAPVVSYPSASHLSSRFRESSSLGVAPVVSYPAGGSLASSRYSEHSSSGLNGGFVAPVVSYPAGGSSQFREQSSSSTGGFGSGGIGVTYSSYPSASHNLASRFGSGFDSTSFGSSNLGQYMGESERLARLQAQNIQGAGGYKSTSTVNFGNAQFAPSAGGHTKSWEKSSKWSAQSEYDQSGRTKSNSYLSTAEGEDQTLNGRTTGFRAATTTVEDDGKRSTYSIHTP